MEWIAIVAIFVIVVLIYNRYKNLVRHEDEKVNEIWESLKKKYLNLIEKLSNELPEKEIEKTLKNIKSDCPEQRKIDDLERSLNKELESIEKRHGKVFRKKLNQKYSNYEISRFER